MNRTKFDNQPARREKPLLRMVGKLASLALAEERDVRSNTPRDETVAEPILTSTAADAAAICKRKSYRNS